MNLGTVWKNFEKVSTCLMKASMTVDDFAQRSLCDWMFLPIHLRRTFPWKFASQSDIWWDSQLTSCGTAACWNASGRTFRAASERNGSINLQVCARLFRAIWHIILQTCGEARRREDLIWSGQVAVQRRVAMPVGTEGFQFQVQTLRSLKQLTGFCSTCPACTYSTQNEESHLHCKMRIVSSAMGAKALFNIAYCVVRVPSVFLAFCGWNDWYAYVDVLLEHCTSGDIGLSVDDSTLLVWLHSMPEGQVKTI